MRGSQWQSREMGAQHSRRQRQEKYESKHELRATTRYTVQTMIAISSRRGISYACVLLRQTRHHALLMGQVKSILQRLIISIPFIYTHLLNRHMVIQFVNLERTPEPLHSLHCRFANLPRQGPRCKLTHHAFVFVLIRAGPS